MIRSFKGKDAEKIFNRVFVKKFATHLQDAALRKLVLIHTAGKLDDLQIPPGNQLEKLKGDRDGQFSIRVNDQFRICFRWEDGNAFDVEIVDYH